MKYVATVERTAKERGFELGFEEGRAIAFREAILAALQFRVANVPDTFTKMLGAIDDANLLHQILKPALTVDSIASFAQFVARAFNKNGIHDEQT